MLFNSFNFAVFFAVFYALYLTTLPRVKIQNILVLVGSCVFYGWWDWRFLLLMGFTILVDYNVGRLIQAEDDEKKRRLILYVSIVSNLSILCFFKYFNFFIQSFEQLLGGLGISASIPVLSIILPVGISFYTFQSMSYVIDIYRRDIEATDSLISYAAYVSFFPQLVAGPIERASRLLPQMLNKRSPRLDQIYEGCYLIYWGLFKKIFIADNLSKIVNPIFASPNPSSEQIMLGAYAFAFQIYCDFSAYSDIARGLAKTMGFELMLNFNLPYTATNPSDFWRRWHISLSTWLRDYLYKPLGGSHGGSLFTYRNLMLTMLLGGLWHGAHANFVIWGFYQGVLLIFHRLYCNLVKDIALFSPSKPILIMAGRFISWFVFFNLMCLGWLIFRATSESQIVDMVSTLAGGFNIIEFIKITPKFGFYILPLLAIQFFQYRYKNLNFMLSMPWFIRAAFYVGLFYIMLSLGALQSSEFIYFQF